jgi:hypothetical protein
VLGTPGANAGLVPPVIAPPPMPPSGAAPQPMPQVPPGVPPTPQPMERTGMLPPGGQPPIPQQVPLAPPGGQQPIGPNRLMSIPGGGMMTPNPATVSPLISEDAKEVAADRENAIKGQQDVATIKAIQDFLPKVATGWGADTKLEAGRILQAAGVPPDQIQSMMDIDPASGQILQKKFLELSTAAARTLGAREPGSVIQMFGKAYPSLGTTPDAITLQTNALLMDRQRQQALAAQKTNYLNQSVNNYQSSGTYRGLQGFNEQFQQTNAPEDYLRAAEAMSGPKWSPWARITDPAHQHQIISLIPSGTQFVGPDGKMYVRQ